MIGGLASARDEVARRKISHPSTHCEDTAGRRISQRRECVKPGPHCVDGRGNSFASCSRQNLLCEIGPPARLAD
jgi:hypothetical protein